MAVQPQVMGILNVTPDSFSDGGLFMDPDSAIAQGRRLAAAGADVVDVGGESSRPGADPVEASVEIERVVPVIEVLSREVRVSIDTAKADVARAAVAAGATIINDITASLHQVAAESGAGWVAMHMQGEPRTMQHAPTYEDVVGEVLAHLLCSAEMAHAEGVGEIWIDPGIGFGKSSDHNWALLRALPIFVASGWPVAVGASRKAFLGAALADIDGFDGAAPADDRLEASVVTSLRAARDGAAMVRVHDVAATVAALRARASAA